MSGQDRTTLAAAVDVLLRGRVVVMTGAGISTDSGIPDYRGPGAAQRRPMSYADFAAGPSHRQRYWARSHVGWNRMARAEPNGGHRAVSALQRSGVVSAVITQNVDRLHAYAGTRDLVELHGRIDYVVCLGCSDVSLRADLDQRLADLNPGWLDAHSDESDLVAESAPDGDATVEDSRGFRVAGCTECGGVLKPDLVFFGENVPVPRVLRCYDLVDAAGALLVAGSSLTVFSGRRFVRRASDRGIPVVIVNRGPTRGDAMADIRIDAGCTQVLTELASACDVGVVTGQLRLTRDS